MYTICCLNEHEHRLIMRPMFDMRQLNNLMLRLLHIVLNEHEHRLIMWLMFDMRQCKQFDTYIIAYTFKRTRTLFNHVVNVGYETM